MNIDEKAVSESLMGALIGGVLGGLVSEYMGKGRGTYWLYGAAAGVGVGLLKWQTEKDVNKMFSLNVSDKGANLTTAKGNFAGMLGDEGDLWDNQQAMMRDLDRYHQYGGPSGGPNNYYPWWTASAAWSAARNESLAPVYGPGQQIPLLPGQGGLVATMPWHM